MDHYSPPRSKRSRQDHSGPNNYDSYRPTKQPRYTQPSHQFSTSDPTSPKFRNSSKIHKSQHPSSNSNKKSKSDRKNNPSTRIHSLKRLLSNAAESNLPATIRQEKERELAGLLMDQTKTRLAKDSKKNTSKYHMVRFIERQKATRLLKKLNKIRDGLMHGTGVATPKEKQGEEHGQPDRNDAQMDIDPTTDPTKSKFLGQIESQIHDAEISLNYTIYCPLGRKYISIFTDPGPDHRTTKASAFRLDEDEYSVLTPQQKQELAHLEDHTANLARGARYIEAGRPPVWLEIKEVMEQTEHDPQKREERLLALREGRNGNAKGAEDRELVHRTNKTISGGEERSKKEGKLDWLHDNGVIDPEDLDSESDSDDGMENGMALDHVGQDDDDNDDEDEEKDISDGGFFEK